MVTTRVFVAREPVHDIFTSVLRSGSYVILLVQDDRISSTMCFFSSIRPARQRRYFKPMRRNHTVRIVRPWHLAVGVGRCGDMRRDMNHTAAAGEEEEEDVHYKVR